MKEVAVCFVIHFEWRWNARQTGRDRQTQAVRHTHTCTPARSLARSLAACANNIVQLQFGFCVFHSSCFQNCNLCAYSLSEFWISVRFVPVKWQRNYSSSYGHVLPHALAIHIIASCTPCASSHFFSSPLNDRTLHLTRIHHFQWDWEAHGVRQRADRRPYQVLLFINMYLSVKVDAPRFNDFFLFVVSSRLEESESCLSSH